MVTTTQTLGELAEAFLLSKRVSGCTVSTVASYDRWLSRVVATTDVLDARTVGAFFTALQAKGLSAGTIHQGYRTLRVFCRWLMDTGALERDPLRSFRMRVPRTLPRVPTEEEVRALVAACVGRGAVGRRNRTLILVLADAGLRASELLHLLVEDWNPSERSLFVRSGKGRKDRVVFLSPTTVRALREYLGARRYERSKIAYDVHREDFLFVDRVGCPIKYRHLVQILHRLSARAGLSRPRRIHPHALRHFAATAWLRNGVGLDEVRRLLGHENLHTTLRYSALVAVDLQAAHRRAGAIERMRLD